MTNNHVLPAEYLQSNESFEIKIKDKSFKINLNNKDFLFTSELLDVTFVQLTNDEFFNNPEIDFLDFEVNENENYEKQAISAIHYPKGELIFSHGEIIVLKGFNYYHTVPTNNGSSGSPLINNNNLKVIGIHKMFTVSSNRLSNKNVATELGTIVKIINYLYDKNYIYDIKKAREKTKLLNDNELKELENHGLEKTDICNIFKCPYLKSNNKSWIVLYYKTNHGWYCTIKIEKRIKYEYKYFKAYDWIFIDPNDSIENIINNINRTSKVNLEHRHEVIIMWLKQSGFMYM